MAYDWRDMEQFNGYKTADSDVSSATHYYGFLNADGSWYIMREAPTAVGYSYRYSRSGADYATSWAGRALLTYDYFDVVF